MRIDALHEGRLARTGHAYADDGNGGLLAGRSGGVGVCGRGHGPYPELTPLLAHLGWGDRRRNLFVKLSRMAGEVYAFAKLDIPLY